VLRRFLAGEARRRELGGVTADLHLARESELVGREAEAEVEVRVERLGRRVGDRRIQPLVHLGEDLLHLAE
jgi:hypothetical protein